MITYFILLPCFIFVGFASSGIATEYREYKNKQDIVLVFKKITAQGRNKGGAD